ncbi:MAG: branched-chain amino acid ABC transporter permease, partial [Pseudanabaena sp.]
MAEFFNTYGFLIVSAIFGAILGISVYLPLMAGQLSLATSGFYSLGGYIAAIASTKILITTTGTLSIGWVLIEMLVA